MTGSESRKTHISWVLRDMMQSTGIWTFQTEHIENLVEKATNVGFYSLEIGGGQSYQMALGQGLNPYELLRIARNAVINSGNKLPLQILLRGANQLGFKHYPPSLQQKNIDLLVEAGSSVKKETALIIRNFDALNDAENLRYSIDYMVRKDLQAAADNAEAEAAGKEPTAKRLHVQAALSYVRAETDEDQACYGVKYYVEYAQRLIEIAKTAGGMLDSLCIKDMSGQLAPDVAKYLVPALKKLGLPVFLHCHSTDESKATATQYVAVDAGIDGIEVAVAPLAGGTSHNDIDTVSPMTGVQDLDPQAIKELKEATCQIFGDRIAERQDLGISMGALKRMVSIGVPGGAIPFILSDLNEQVCKMMGISIESALDLFEKELVLIQEQLGNVPLVTPTADIVAKQTINNLTNQARAATYKVIDPRFCSLVLGHYGEVNNYASGDVVKPSEELVAEIAEYCSAIEPDSHGVRIKAGAVYPEPEALTEHPAQQASEEDYELSREYISELFRRYPKSCQRYGSQEECFVLHIMRPSGNTDRLLSRNILGPTEDRLRFILDTTLHLLPGGDIPESRDPLDDEQANNQLISELGSYEGFVDLIKDLVLSGTKASVRERLYAIMNKVVDPICEVNEEAKANRYYLERRFVSIFASAVFWDLQRVCRRTGNDSRSDIDERTAFKLERIISFTLRKRQLEGRGQASAFTT